MQRTVDRWVEALQSGRYAQGRSRLSSFEEGRRVHCVMGVLMDLDFQLQRTQEHNIPLQEKLHENISWRDSGRIMPNCRERLEQLGLAWLIDSEVMPETSGTPQDVLISANDAGETFDELIERIRAMDERYAETA